MFHLNPFTFLLARHVVQMIRNTNVTGRLVDCLVVILMPVVQARLLWLKLFDITEIIQLHNF